MNLELANFPIRDVRFGKHTNYTDGVLEIDKEELLALVLSDGKITSADLDMAFPNEQTRIVNIRDVVEPRIKVSGRGCVFPGILGPIETVGEGRTNRLSGVTVIPSVEYRPTVQAGVGAGSAGVLDMWGPMSQLTPLGSTINIVPILKLVDGINELEAHNTIQMAEFKVAQRLAETTRNETPKNVEKFELFEADPSLPKVIYIFSFVTYQITPEQAHSTLAFYGLSVDESLPSFIHPNEFLDGALTADARKGRSGELSSWGLMNHPVVLALLREHGKRLNFLGVILQRTRFLSEYGKHVTAQATSQLARLLGADGVITTRTSPSGNNMIEIMLTLKACEEKGIKTVTLAPEWGGLDGTEQPLVFHLPEADAVISTCSMDRIIEVPAPKKVIGLGDNKLFTIAGGEQPISPWGELVLDTRTSIAEGIDFLGMNNYTCKVY